MLIPLSRQFLGRRHPPITQINAGSNRTEAFESTKHIDGTKWSHISFRKYVIAVVLTAGAPERAPLELAGVQLNDQLFVDHRLDFFARRNAGNFAFESVAIDRQPVGDWNDLR